MKTGHWTAAVVAALMLGGLLLSGTAAAAVIGHPLKDRGKLDQWDDFSAVDTALAFSGDGYVDAWSIYAEQAGEIVFQVYRLIDAANHIYEVVGENAYTVSSQDTGGVLTFDVPESQRIRFAAGDFLGWTFDDTPVFGHDKTDTTGTPRFPANEGLTARGAGATLNFPKTDPGRTYSIQAETSPVPLPGAVCLLGSGLIGLLGLGRRRSRQSFNGLSPKDPSG